MLLFTSMSIATLNLWPVLLCFLGGALLPETSAAKEYWEAGVKKHNEYRAAHGAPLMELDEKLAEMADTCAKYYTDNNLFDHSCPHKGGSGENLYKSFGTKHVDVKSVEDATKVWYDEIKDYDFNKYRHKDGKRWQDTGHFTQVIWKDSIRLGIGYSVSAADKSCVVVALYSPTGNYPDKHKENVLPPKAGVPNAGVPGQNSTALSILAACLTLSLRAMSVGSTSGR